MAGLKRRLPPLTGLATFEAVARLASFTRAAAELGVTQAAVSRQIHLLEHGFGFPLFHRLHRRVELTQKGRALSLATTTAFGLIVDTLDEITGRDGDDELSIAASVAVSHFWLLPRISSFSRDHPQINLRIITQDGPSGVPFGDVDLAIRYGNGLWPDGRAELLFDDEIFPVCSPQYAADRLGEADDLADLVRHPLITSDAGDATWTGWTEWLAAFSVQLPRRPTGMRCSFYTEAIHAALNGQGIALGWRRLVQDLLDQNRLVRVGDKATRTRSAYFVVGPERRGRTNAADIFIDWLRAEAASQP